jgi:hypothetical protein
LSRLYEKKKRVMLVFYICAGAAAEVAGCVCCGFIWKKATARSNSEIHIRSNPMPTAMINTAPMSISKPDVENKPTPDFAESEISERRAR